MSENLFTIRTQRKHFLSPEQTRDIVIILSNNVKSRTDRELIRLVIFNRFLSLDNLDYWKQFFIEGNYIIFKEKKNRALELSEIRKSILNQASLMFQTI